MQVVFRKTNPVQASSNLRYEKIILVLKKAARLGKKIIVVAFWLLVAYVVWQTIVMPTIEGCNQIGTWNC